MGLLGDFFLGKANFGSAFMLELSACRTFPGLIDPLPSSSFCNSNLASRYSLAIFGLMTNPYSSATARDHEGSPVGVAGSRTRAIRAAALRRSSSVRLALRARRNSESSSTAACFWLDVAADFAFVVLARALLDRAAAERGFCANTSRVAAGSA